MQQRKPLTHRQLVALRDNPRTPYHVRYLAQRVLTQRATDALRKAAIV